MARGMLSKDGNEWGDHFSPFCRPVQISSRRLGRIPRKTVGLDLSVNLTQFCLTLFGQARYDVSLCWSKEITLDDKNQRVKGKWSQKKEEE